MESTKLKQITLLLLRVTMGWLMVVWGADKVFNPEHGMAVANKFYFGFLGAESALLIGGILQMLLGLAIVVGFARRWVYPVQAVLAGATLLAVYASVLDPWGWVLSGTNALFYPSVIIFAASLVLIAFREDDSWVIG